MSQKELRGEDSPGLIDDDDPTPEQDEVFALLYDALYKTEDAEVRRAALARADAAYMSTHYLARAIRKRLDTQ